MRPIKFRAWDNEQKKICNKVYIGPEGWHGEYWEDGMMVLCFSDINDSGNVLMQFTGLHDKNGKEIWEGDILAPGWNEGEVYIVRFDMMKARFCEQRHLIGNAICDYGYFMDGSMMRDNLKIEVLGNIYNNSELLGGKN